MNRIRRILLSRVGYRDAWFDGAVLHFHAPDGQPDHSIISLPNGEGKTTLLSLIFTVLVPRQQRFVQHLQKPGHHFRDYFSTRPGFIVIEMQRPGSGLFQDDPQNRFIAGQMVCLRERDHELERIFFSFSPSAALTFDTLPIRGLDNSDEIKDLNSAQRWIHTARDSIPGFRSFKQHQDWEKHLEEEGADPWLADRQVDFCSVEGGIDSFLDFRTEIQFLRRFYAMALPTDAAESARETLGTALSKQRARPETQDRIQALEQLADRFEPFVRAASDRAQALRTLHESRSRIAGLHHALQTLHQRLSAEQQQRLTDQSHLERQIDELEVQIADSQGRVEAIEAIDHARRIAMAARRQQQATLRMQELEHRRRCLTAAKALRRLRDAEQRVEGFRQALNTAEHDLAPIQRRAQEAGNRLRARLRYDAQALRQSQANAEREIQVITTRMQATSIDIKQRQQNLNRMERDSGSLRQQIEARDHALDRLRRQGGAIAAEEPAITARSRHEQHIAHIEQCQRENQERIRALRIERSESENQAAEHRAQAARKQVSHDETRQQIAKGEAQREHLSRSSLLCRLLDAETIDPDAEGLNAHLQTHIRDLMSRHQQIQRRLDELQHDRASIAATGLAAPDDDVQSALEWLTQHGQTQVNHYPAYLAEVLDEASKARQCMESDPARFSGLQVYSPETLATIRTLPREGLRLRRPVQVSLSRAEPTPAPIDAIVLSQPFDALYDKAAAAEYAQRLERQYEDLSADMHRLECERDAAQAESSALERYLDEFGASRLSTLRRILAQLEQDIAQQQQYESNARKRLAEIDAELQALEDANKTLNSERDEAREHLQSVSDFIRDHEANHAERLNRLSALQDQLRDLADEIAELEEQNNADTKARETLSRQANEAGHEAVQLERELSNVEQYDDHSPVDEASWKTVPRSTLDADYQTHCQCLVAAAHEHGLHEIQARLDAANETRATAEVEYHRVAKHLESAEIEAWLSQDLDALEERATLEYTQALQGQATWKEKLQRAERDSEDFTRERRFKNVCAPDLEQVTDAELSAALTSTQTRWQTLTASHETHRTKRQTLKMLVVEHDARIKQNATRLKTLESELVTDVEPSPVHLPASDEALEQLHTECLSGLKAAARMHAEADKKARALLENIHLLLDQGPLKRLEPQISVELRTTGFEAACTEAGRHQSLIDDRIATCRFDLETLDKNLDVVRHRLLALLDEAIALLNRAVNSVRIPASVPHFGDQPILRMRLRFGKLAAESRDERLRHYIDQLAREDRLPATGADLAAELVGETAKALSPDGSLGLSFLKPTDLGPRHEGITMRVGSGGESMTAAMLLYLLMAQLRARAKAARSHANSGFLILDNPFGKANKVTLIRPQVELARQLGIQLIYATGIQDYNALAEFGHLIRLRRAGTHSETGRTHLATIETAEYDVHAHAR